MEKETQKNYRIDSIGLIRSCEKGIHMYDEMEDRMKGLSL
jgi:hypothetical protein